MRMVLNYEIVLAQILVGRSFVLPGLGNGFGGLNVPVDQVRLTKSESVLDWVALLLWLAFQSITEYRLMLECLPGWSESS